MKFVFTAMKVGVLLSFYVCACVCVLAFALEICSVSLDLLVVVIVVCQFNATFCLFV